MQYVFVCFEAFSSTPNHRFSGAPGRSQLRKTRRKESQHFTVQVAIRKAQNLHRLRSELQTEIRKSCKLMNQKKDMFITVYHVF